MKNQAFKLKIVPIYSTLLELITTGHLEIYAVVHNNKLAALWFFRKSDSKYLNHTIIEMYCLYEYIINQGTIEIIYSTYIISKIDEDYLIMHNLSMKNINISKILGTPSPIYVIKMEYYYYNFIQLPLKEEETFILC